MICWNTMHARIYKAAPLCSLVFVNLKLFVVIRKDHLIEVFTFTFR